MGNCSECQTCHGSFASARETDGFVRSKVPLLLHFDVNKTVLLSDSIQMKTIEQGLREGIGELFWGTVADDPTGASGLSWHWTCDDPSSAPPQSPGGVKTLTYVGFCKQQVKDKAERKVAITSFQFVKDQKTKQKMEELLQMALRKMQLNPDVKAIDAENAGLKGSTLVMLPAVFHLISLLLRSKCTFAILFRSFGSDHDRIKNEWNAFCEMRHPVFSYLLAGMGPLDGSVSGVPDRRIHRIHTLYRDTEGPMLILDTFTNGPEETSWDNWAKQKPRPTADTRDGRKYIAEIQAKVVDGLPAVQTWMRQQLMSQETAAIKDDWAWWQWNGETASAGKLLTCIGGVETRQLFFDDNIEGMDNLKIVDCRDAKGDALPADQALNKLCVTVNPVEALLDDGYFARKLLRCYNDQFDEESLGYTLMPQQSQQTTQDLTKSS